MAITRSIYMFSNVACIIKIPALIIKYSCNPMSIFGHNSYRFLIASLNHPQRIKLIKLQPNGDL